MARDNLPHPLSSFVGRSSEIRHVAALVSKDRLVTLVGPGGSGKSRLALEVGSACVSRFADDVSIVELASVVESTLVPRAVANALQITDRPGRHIAAVVSDVLRMRHSLLILDNCEHVAAEVASLVNSLLRACPRLHVLATSRVAIGVEGERTWSVPAMTTREAVGLLAERASGFSPGLVIRTGEMDIAAEICRRLDGMPLAIELAAARLKTLSLEQVASRLSNRFDLLTRGNRQAQPRQRTLKATMDWSYELLSADARRVWRHAAVFVGGFELAALEAVWPGEQLEPAALVDAVEELIDNSIVELRANTNTRRFRMLDTVREYGVLKLEEAGEGRSAKARHLRWFLDLALRAEPEWRGPNQRAWLDRLGVDIDNIRAALQLAQDDASLADDGLRLASALWLLWHSRHIGEGRARLDGLLDRGSKSAPRATAFNVAGFLAYVQGDAAAGVHLLEASLTASHDLGDAAGARFSLVRLGIALLYDNRIDEAIAVLTDALRLYREAHDRIGVYVAAYELAEALTMRGDHADARALHEESLALKEEQGDRWHIALSCFGIGLLDWAEGSLRTATERLRESLRIRRDLDEDWGIAKSIEGLGWVEISRGRAARGVTLLGASSAINERLGVVLSKNYQALHEPSIAAAREKLDNVQLEAAWRHGTKLSQADAIAYALRDDAAAPAATNRRHGVTQREREVAQLVAAGMTNRDIARNLGVAERTVDAHVEHLMNKLGYHSRAQIAAWVTTAGT